jgi:aminopeptidase N
VLYDKGCLLLHDLAADIGEDNLQVLLRTVYQKRVDSTTSFLALLAEEYSRNTAEAFEALLHR